MEAVQRRAAAESLETALEMQNQILLENQSDPDAEVAAKAAEGLRLLQMLRK